MIPANCILWKKEALTSDDLSHEKFESVSERSEDFPHVSARVKRCKECGQLYLFEYNDFFASPYSDDLPVYMTYVPVSEKEIEKLQQQSHSLTLLQNCIPRLLHDVTQSGESIRWVR